MMLDWLLFIAVMLVFAAGAFALGWRVGEWLWP